MQVRRVGEHGLLVECADQAEVSASYALLRSREALVEAVDIVPAARTVLLDGLSDPMATAELISPWQATVDGSSGRPVLVEIPTVYDGADLGEVARQWGMTKAEVVSTHRDTVFEVAFCGFVPGFGYCTGLPADLGVTRREEPRVAVPAGSVALAAEFTAVYPRESPGGWQLIGRTSIGLWDPDAADPALLAPGVQVRFVDA